MPEAVQPSDQQLYSHQQELLTRGYTILPDILSASEVTTLREVVDALYRGRKLQTDFRYYGSPSFLARLPPSCRALLALD
jgi:hypothetical protein